MLSRTIQAGALGLGLLLATSCAVDPDAEGAPDAELANDQQLVGDNQAGDYRSPANESVNYEWGSYGDSTTLRARSYINPDIGAATANTDVDPGSSCANPDRRDTQQRSDPGTANRNVHNDACFFEGGSYDSSARKVDAPASYDSSGVGFISACPDPDGAGPKYAFTRDRNGDGLADLCFQSGYQEKGTPGDLEFHARLNNTTTVGTQVVVWCYDPDRDGCSDERAKDRIEIYWR